MGLFKAKVRHPLAGLTPHQLKQGGQVPLVEVPPDFVTYVRATRPRRPRVGHAVPVALVIEGNEIVAYYDDQRVGSMARDSVQHYAVEMMTLKRRNQYGLTEAYIKPEGAKSSHALALNWGEKAIAGGIL